VTTGGVHMVQHHLMHIILKKVGLILMEKKKVAMKNLRVKIKRKRRIKRKIKRKIKKMIIIIQKDKKRN
jgi:hypothetical protein